MTIQELLIELSDLIDRREYEDNWDTKAQEMITDISDFLKGEEADEDDRGVPSMLDGGVYYGQ
jgi:hypothetical protein